MFTRSQIFYFFVGFVTTLTVGFFVWNNYINQIDSKVITASVLPVPLDADAPVVADEPPPVENLAVDEAPVVLTDEERQNLIDDIKEKLDLIQQQVNELIAEQKQDDSPPPEATADQSQDNDQSDIDQDDNQNNSVDEDTTTVCAGQININTASAQDLDKITQVGPATAQKIIAVRPFYSLDDLLRVSGIGSVTLQKIKDQGCAFVEPGLAPPASGGGGTPAPVLKNILISEFQVEDGTVNDDYVELYNPNDGAVSLNNWSIQKASITGKISHLKNFDSSDSISAKGYFLIVNSGANQRLLDLADMKCSALDLSSEFAGGNTIYLIKKQGVITDDNDPDIVNEVGYGMAKNYVGLPALKPSAGKSTGRIWDELLQKYKNIPNNSADFEIDTPTPRTQNKIYSAPILQSIAITTPATKLNYTVGDTLDITGLVVTGTYSDSSIQTESITASNITGFDSSSPATGQILTITLEGQITNYMIDIQEVVLPSIATYTISNTTISPNDDGVADTTSIDLLFSEKVDYKIYILSGETVIKSWLGSATNPDAKIWDGKDDSGAVVLDGVYTIKIVITNSAKNSVTDTSKAITVDTSVPPAPTLSSIAITTPATKLNYIVGDVLDIAGLVVTGTYSDNSTQNETITIADVTGFDSSVAAVNQVLTITVAGQTATYTVNVAAQDNTATQLKIITSPQTISVGVPSSVFTVEAQNSVGISTKVLATTYVNLSSSSPTGLFALSSASGPCNTDWTKTSATISKNTANKSFCYKDSVAGTFTITVLATGLSSDSQTVIVNP